MVRRNTMNKNLLYSKFKILKHLKKLDIIKSGKIPSPTLVRIDLTNNCNHRCIYCMYQKSLPEFNLCDNFNFSYVIEKWDAIKLLDDIKSIGTKAVMFTGGGEPTIHKNIKEILNYSLNKDLEVGLLTNGAKLDRSWIKLLRHKNFKWIRISLDAATETTWKKVHRPIYGNNLKRILNLIKYYKNNGIKAEIGTSFVINDYNWKEIFKFTQLCKKHNVDNVRLSFTYQIKREKLYRKNRKDILFLLNQAEKLSTKNFYVNILKERLESIENKDKKYKKCYFIHFSTSVGADLKLYPCCMTKYCKKYIIGDIKKNGFLSVWNKNMKKFTKKLDVTKCPSCWYDYFNEMCEYYCSEDKKFKNFIN